MEQKLNEFEKLIKKIDGERVKQNQKEQEKNKKEVQQNEKENQQDEEEKQRKRIRVAAE